MRAHHQPALDPSVMVNPLNIIVNVNSVINAQKNARNVNAEDQNDAPSSNANIIPPMGALKAAAIPAAAPKVIKSRFERSLRRS